MTKKNHRKLKNYMVAIAKLYGAKVLFIEGTGGSAELDGRIFVGTSGTKRGFISTFCHELGHHINQIDKKYPIYHRYPGVEWKQILHMSPAWKIAYAYRAEAYTDKVGKQVCALWFPGVKYHGFYSGDKLSKVFMEGYYLSWAYGKDNLTPSPLPYDTGRNR